MAGITRVEIQESVEELAAQLQTEPNLNLKERLQVLYLMKLPNAMSISEIAVVVGKHRGTLQRWLSVYQAEGLSGLMQVKQSPGRPCVIPGWAVKRLQQRLAEPVGFKSYGAVQQWLEDTLGVKAEYRTVHELVRYRLKAKLKAARPVHAKQNAAARAGFKQTLATI
jgi:transposase